MADEEQKVKYPEGNDGLLPVFLDTLSSCEDNRRRHDEVCEEIERLVANRYDWSKKAEWQSKVGLPTFASNREKFAAVMQKGLVQANDYFVVEGKAQSQYRQFAASVRDWVRFRLNQEDFLQKFAAAAKLSATRGRMYFKPHYAQELREVLVWGREETPITDAEGNPQFDPITQEPMVNVATTGPAWETRAEQHLRVEMVHPRYVWHDPSGRNRFIIHEYKMDWGELLALAEDENTHYDLEAVKRLEPSAKSEDENDDAEVEERDQHDEGESGEVINAKEITLHEFWGDLYDTEGRLVDKNCTFTVANKTEIVRQPVKNPYWHGKFPFVWGAPVIEPNSVYDKSFMKDACDIQRAQTEFVNLTLDAAKLAVAPPTTLDIEQAVDVNDYKRGLYPGCVIKVRGSWSNGQQPLNTARLSPIDPMSTSVVALLDRENQRATGVTDLMQGVMPARRETASGGAMRLNESAGLFDTYARNLEKSLIGPLVEQVWALDLQYYDWTDPCARDVMGDFADILASMTDEERYRLIEHFEFKGEGLSVLLSREQGMQYVEMWLGRVGRYPMIGQRVNIDYLLEKAAEATPGFDPKRLLNAPGVMNPVPGKEPPGQIPQAGLPPQAMQAQQGGAPQGAPSGLPPQLMQLLASPQGQAMLAQLMGGGMGG